MPISELVKLFIDVVVWERLNVVVGEYGEAERVIEVRAGADESSMACRESRSPALEWAALRLKRPRILRNWVVDEVGKGG